MKGSKPWYYPAGLIIPLLAGTLLFSACGSLFPAKDSSEQTGTSETISENSSESRQPLCLQKASAVAGYDNLYTLDTDSFGRKNYSEMASLGDYVLLIKENYYFPESDGTDETDASAEAADAGDSDETDVSDETDSSAGSGTSTSVSDNSGAASEISDALDEEWNDWEEPNLYYDFDLYDPQTNSILTSFTTDKNTYSSYSVSGDRLIITDLYTGSFSVYDSQLSPAGTCDDTELTSRCGQPVYWDQEGDFYFCYDWVDECMIKIDPADFSYTLLDNGTRSDSPVAVSPDGSRSLYSGVDKETLRYHIYAADSDTGEELGEIPGSSYTGKLNDNYYMTDISSDIPVSVVSDYMGNADYFSCGNLQCLDLLDDGTVLLARDDYNTVSGQSTVLFLHYDPAGEVLSSFLYDLGENSENSSFFYLNACAPVKNSDCVLLLYQQSEQASQLMIWDTSAGKNDADISLASFSSAEEAQAAYQAGTASSISALKQVDTDGNPVVYEADSDDDDEVLTLIDDPDQYDWGELSEENSQADALEEQYGITILIGPEVPADLGGYHISQDSNPDDVEAALTALASILGHYPDGFFPQLLYGNLNEIRIYLSGTLSGDTEGMLETPGGFVCSSQNKMLMVMDVNYVYSWTYMINHEFSHIIDRRLEFIETYVDPLDHTLEGWNALNPEGFDYLYTYADYEGNPLFDADYFCDSYGTTYATEDRAEIFGNAMDQVESGYDWMGYFDEGSHIREKMEYYCAWIREGFDTTGWPETTDWEAVLN